MMNKELSLTMMALKNNPMIITVGHVLFRGAHGVVLRQVAQKPACELHPVDWLTFLLSGWFDERHTYTTNPFVFDHLVYIENDPLKGCMYGKKRGRWSIVVGHEEIDPQMLDVVIEGIHTIHPSYQQRDEVQELNEHVTEQQAPAVPQPLKVEYLVKGSILVYATQPVYKLEVINGHEHTSGVCPKFGSVERLEFDGTYGVSLIYTRTQTYVYLRVWSYGDDTFRDEMFAIDEEQVAMLQGLNRKYAKYASK